MSSPAAPTQGPSSSENNNVRYVIPGLSKLSSLLTRSFSQSAASPAQGLAAKLEKDMLLYESKCDLYLLHLSNQAPVKEGGVKELAPECPLRFWFAQVSRYINFRNVFVTDSNYLGWLTWLLHRLGAGGPGLAVLPSHQCPLREALLHQWHLVPGEELNHRSWSAWAANPNHGQLFFVKKIVNEIECFEWSLLKQIYCF